MQQKTFNFFYAFLLAILGFGATLMAEDITLTTYYPAPYGVYEQLDVDTNLTNNAATTTALNIDVDESGTNSGTIRGLNVDVSGVGSGTAYAAIIQGGNVGIGTVSPRAKLDIVADDTVVKPFLRLYDTAGITSVQASIFEVYNTYLARKMLDINGAGTIRHYDPVSGSMDTVLCGSPSYINSGNVGIGTASPNYTLEVAGTIRSTGKGTFTGGIDPPYVSFTSESHESIRKRAKDVEEHEKVMQFWNGNKHRLEVYVIEEDRFYTIRGELIEE